MSGLGFSKPKNPGGLPDMYGPYDRSKDPNYQEKHADYDGNSNPGQDYPDGTYYRRREQFYEGFTRDSAREWNSRGHIPDRSDGTPGDEAWRREWRKRWRKKAKDAGMSDEDADGMIAEMENAEHDRRYY